MLLEDYILLLIRSAKRHVRCRNGAGNKMERNIVDSGQPACICSYSFGHVVVSTFFSTSVSPGLFIDIQIQLL